MDQYGKALDAFRQKDYANAVSACQKLVQLNPTSAEAHFLLGVAFEASESPDSAISEFQQALRLNPKYSEAASGLAEAYQAKGMDRESKEAARKAAEIKGGR